MRWVRPILKEKCTRRFHCVSPRGHYGPCQEWKDGKLVFVDEDGKPIPELNPEPKKRPDDDPFGWRE